MFSLNTTVVGLITQLIGIPTANMYYLKGTLTLPDISKGNTANSQVVVTITQTPHGGSPTTIYTGLPGAEGFGIEINAAALDIFAVTMSSSATVDQGLQAVKTTISVG
jgi:hypothetical protein